MKSHIHTILHPSISVCSKYLSIQLFITQQVAISC